MSDKIREVFDAWRSSRGWQRPDDPGEWEAWQAALAQRPTDAMLDEMRRRGLSIDGDNTYKRDLIDCIIGALVCGKQNTNPPPAGHWAQQFWEIGRAEGEIQEGDYTPAAPEPAAQEPVAWRVSEPDDPEIGHWLSEEPGASWQKSEPLYTAPPAAVQPDSKYRCPSCHEPVAPPAAWSAQVHCAACGKASAATAALSSSEQPEAQEPIKLSDDVREFLQEWIGSAIEDDDHDFAGQLEVLLGPIYTAPPAAVQPDATEAMDTQYPPCDYCGAEVNYMPWHGSGLLEGVESRHVHACDACRYKLPAAEQPDTVFSMLGEDDMHWLRRFRDCREGDEDEHDLPETVILSLEALGALRSIGYEQHELTKFGDYLLGKESA